MIIYVNTEDMRSYALTQNVTWKTIEVEVPDDFVGGGKRYDLETQTWIDDVIEPPTQQEIDAQKEAENIDFLSSETRRTNDAIEVLNDAIEFEEATDEEVAQHKSLRKYRLDLSRVPNQETWPLNPVWPTCPEFFKPKE